MITESKYKAKVLVFWEKYDLELHYAFPVKRPTIFLWKKLREGRGKLEALNDQRRVPRIKRKRVWPFEIRQKIRAIRSADEHPNLAEKIHPLLLSFFKEQELECPRPRTIARIIADDPEKMPFPRK